MDGALKGLVAAACVAVLAASGWWGWSEWSEAQEQAEMAEAEAASARRLRAFEHEEHLRECRGYVAAWEGGDWLKVSREFGTYAGQVVDNCRYLLAIPEESFSDG